MLVIDDNSPTAPASWPTSSPRSSTPSSVLHRERKEGLGPAYLAGFRRALADGAELILEMDCDFSHEPEDVARLIARAEEGADLVLGSRYVPGGQIPNWGLLRRFISRGGCIYAQLWLQVRVRDLTGGFKCYRREVLETIDLDAIDAKGYAFQIETTYRALRKGFPSPRCRSPSSTARRAARRCRRASCSRRSGRCPRCASQRSPAGCEAFCGNPDARSERRDSRAFGLPARRTTAQGRDRGRERLPASSQCDCSFASGSLVG